MATRVLVVEDDETIRELLLVALGEAGYEAVTADQGTAAETARETRPDVILLDLMMPGTPGEAVFARLKADPGTSAIPVLLCSAVSSAATVGRRLGCGVLLKPFSLPLLEEAIDTTAALAHEVAGTVWKES